jgi:hypothetical protein
MTNRCTSPPVLGCALAIALLVIVPIANGETTTSGLRLVSSKVSLAGTSNIHPWTASSTAARLIRLDVAADVAGEDVWTAVLKPGAIAAFEIAIPAATLTSPKEGLDKNMHKALKVTQHPDITFRLTRLEPTEAAGAMKGTGTLRIAGVEREMTVLLTTQRSDGGLTVTGQVPLLMTDFGIEPPKAMLGMLKTDPKVTVTFETVLGTK